MGAIGIMSRTSLVLISGSWLSNKRAEILVEFIRSHGGSVDIDGFIQGAVSDEDGMSFSRKPINENDSLKLAEKLLDDAELSTIDCHFEFDGIRRYFNCDISNKDQLVIGIHANRQHLDDGMTDFTWYYEHIVRNICNCVLIPTSIVFQDHI